MADAKTKMTNEEYVFFEGARCPFCEGSNIEAMHSVEIDAGEAWQDIQCLECGEEWQDVYKLVGYEKPDRK